MLKCRYWALSLRIWYLYTYLVHENGGNEKCKKKKTEIKKIEKDDF